MNTASINVNNTWDFNRIVYRGMQIMIGLLNVMIFVPAILYKLGLYGLSQATYFVFGFLCHQMPQRSFFLFGPKLMYSKEEMLKSLQWSQMFTLNIRNRFTCSDAFGCKLGVCSRCTGLYMGMLLGMLTAGFIKKTKITRAVLIAIMIPMVLDGGIQLIAALLNPYSPFYESNNRLRLLTGLLFGFGFGALTFGLLHEQIFGELKKSHEHTHVHAD